MLTAALIVFGFVAGFIAGLLGIGGGIVLVPLLIWLLPGLGYRLEDAVQVAVATSLACILVTGAVSAWSHQRRGAVDWALAQRLIPGLLLGALLAGATAHLMGGRALALVFCGFVVFAAVRLLAPAGSPTVHTQPMTPLSLSGFFIGWLSGLVGIGGGTLSVPYLCARGVAIHRAVATAAAVGVPIALSGSLGHGLIAWALSSQLPARAWGYVDGPAWLILTVTGCAAAPGGVALAHRLPVGRLRKVFAVVLLLLAAGMAYRIFGRPGLDGI